MNPNETSSRFSRRDFLKLSRKAGEGLFFLLYAPDPIKAGILGDPKVKYESEPLRENDWVYAKGTTVYLLPMRSDWFYDETKGPALLTLNDPIPFQAKNIRTVQTGNTFTRYAEIPLTGDKELAIVKLDERVSMDEGKTFISEVLWHENRVSAGEKIFGGFTFSAERIVNSVNIRNILEGTSNLLKYQNEHNGFTNGTYSLLNILHARTDPAYQDGVNASKADGIDGIATMISKSLLPLVSGGRAEIVARTPHAQGFAYFAGPTTPDVTQSNSDANVGNADFIWKFTNVDNPLYLWAEASVIPVGDTWDAKKSNITLPADGKLVLTFTWRNTPTRSGSFDRISGLKQVYEAYHEGGPQSLAGQVLARAGGETPTDWKSIDPLVSVVHPEQAIGNFVSEIGHSESGQSLDVIQKFLSTHINEYGTTKHDISATEWFRMYYGLVYHMRDLVQDYKTQFPYSVSDSNAGKPRPTVTLGTYISILLREEGVWNQLHAMSQLKKRPNDKISLLDIAIHHLNDNTYILPDQPMTCVGMAVLLGCLPVPLAPSYIGGEKTAYASGLLHETTKEMLHLFGSYIDSGLLFVRIDTIKDVLVGDLFIRYAGNNKNHTGAVVGRKIVDGRVKLLMADANRKDDGVIRMFEVDQDNFRVIFGEGELTPPVVIRNPAAGDFLKKSS